MTATDRRSTSAMWTGLVTVLLAACASSPHFVQPSSVVTTIELPNTDAVTTTQPSATSVTASDPRASTPSSSGASNDAPKLQARPWVPVTGNLAGTDSECGNLSSLAVRPG